MRRGAPGKAQALSTCIYSKTFLPLEAKFSAQMLVVTLPASSRWSLLALQAPFEEGTLSCSNGHFLSDHFPQRLQLGNARQPEWCQEWPPKWKAMVTRTSPPLPLFAQDSVPLKIRQLLCFVQQNTHPACACDFGLFPRPSLRLWETLGLPPLSPAQSLGSLVFMSTERLPEKTGSCPPGGVWCPARPVVCVSCLSSDQRGSTPGPSLWATRC